MEDKIVSLQVGKLANHKGIWLIANTDGHQKFFDGNYLIYIPTQSLLQKWLREVHGIQIEIMHYTVDGDREQINEEIWHYRVSMTRKPECDTHDIFVESGFITYEEALERGLFEALKLIP